MKKLLSVLLLCLLLLSLTACGNGGDVGEVGIKEVFSQSYTSAEIGDGVNTVLDYFEKEFKGCTLRELEYIGDDNLEPYQEYAQRVGADEVMVFRSNFDVDESGGDGSLNPNTSYMGWLWILARTNGGKWEHVDHGY